MPKPALASPFKGAMAPDVQLYSGSTVICASQSHWGQPWLLHCSLSRLPGMRLLRRVFRQRAPHCAQAQQRDRESLCIQAGKLTKYRDVALLRRP